MSCHIDLSSCPPGFKNGVTFERRKFDAVLRSGGHSSVVSISDILKQCDDIDLGLPTDVTPESKKITDKQASFARL